MDDACRQKLLSLARETVRAHLAGDPLPVLPEMRLEEQEHGGVFVTLRNRGRLRGCIGEFRPGRDLPEAVQRMALAVLEDPRFAAHPVMLAEVAELSFEISVLSPMRRTDAPELLEPGVHGIYVRSGGRGGCFLPQVATEQGWDAIEMLSHCCTHKAGLPADAWKEPGTEVYLFTAEVVEERRVGEGERG